MLQDNGIPFTYREYTREPLSADELRSLLRKLGMGPRDVLRMREAKKLELDDGIDGGELISKMAENPRLLQRPIGVRGERAVVGRPVENLLALND